MLNRLSTHGLITLAILLGVLLVAINIAVQNVLDEAGARDEEAREADELAEWVDRWNNALARAEIKASEKTGE